MNHQVLKKTLEKMLEIFFRCFFNFFLFFFGVFWITFYGHPVGDSAIILLQKKIEYPKIGDTWFFVSRLSKPIGAHATSNVCICILKKLLYSHPVGATEVTLSYKKIENQKIFHQCFFVLPYLEPLSSHRTSNFSIYRYMKIK